MLKTKVFDAIPMLRLLFEESGCTADTEIASRKSGDQLAQYFYINRKSMAYCAVKGNLVQLGKPDKLHRIKSDNDWIDLCDPNSLGIISLRARKLTRG